MTLDVYRGRKTTIQQQHIIPQYVWALKQAIKRQTLYEPQNTETIPFPAENIACDCCCCCIFVLRPRLTSKVMSGRSVNLSTLFLGRLRPPKRLISTSCTYFRQ